MLIFSKMPDENPLSWNQPISQESNLSLSLPAVVVVPLHMLCVEVNRLIQVGCNLTFIHFSWYGLLVRYASMYPSQSLIPELQKSLHSSRDIKSKYREHYFNLSQLSTPPPLFPLSSPPIQGLTKWRGSPTQHRSTWNYKLLLLLLQLSYSLKERIPATIIFWILYCCSSSSYHIQRALIT